MNSGHSMRISIRNFNSGFNKNTNNLVQNWQPVRAHLKIWGGLHDTDVVFKYRISANSFLPGIVSPFNNFLGNYSIYEVKKNATMRRLWKFPHFPLSKKNSYPRNIRKNTVVTFNLVLSMSIKVSVQGDWL